MESTDAKVEKDFGTDFEALIEYIAEKSNKFINQAIEEYESK